MYNNQKTWQEVEISTSSEVTESQECTFNALLFDLVSGNIFTCIKNNKHCKKNEVFQETADLVTFTGEILSGKLHFLCSENLI